MKLFKIFVEMLFPIAKQKTSKFKTFVTILRGFDYSICEYHTVVPRYSHNTRNSTMNDFNTNIFLHYLYHRQLRINTLDSSQLKSVEIE